jgi:tetratricopeptide (TPR) repeat protein
MACFLVLLIVTAVYLPSLGGPFLWDDRRLILESSLIGSSATLGDYLRQPFWTDSEARALSLSYYRPLVTFSFALDHRLHGTNSAGYHLTNILLHLANAGLLFALLRRAGRGVGVAGLVTLGWAVLPRLAEAVAWISGRTDAMATAFVLGALLAWDRSLSRRVLAAALVFTGLLAKESALAVLPALVMFEWSRTPRGAGRVSRLLSRVWPLVAATFAYATLRFLAIGFNQEGIALGAGGRLMTALEAIGSYAAMLLDAWRPRAIIGRVGYVTIAGMAAGAAVAVGTAYGIVRVRRKLDEWQWLGLGLVLFSIAPVLHLFPIPLRTLAADRFLYLPTAGLMLLVAPALETRLARRRPAWVAAVAIVATLTAATVRRVGEWSDEVTFWVESYLQTPPINAAAATELVGVHYRAGLYQRALWLSQRAVRYDDPNRADQHFNAALCQARLGRTEAALESLRRASAGKPMPARVRFQTAIVKIQSGRGNEARKLLEGLAKDDSSNVGALLARLPELERAWNDFVALPPTAPAERRVELASFLGLESSAIGLWTEIVRSGTASDEVLLRALLYLLKTGDRRAIAETAALAARRGVLAPEVAAMAEVRLDELARLDAVWPRLLASESPLP